jgi:hypothetical protein
VDFARLPQRVPPPVGPQVWAGFENPLALPPAFQGGPLARMGFEEVPPTAAAPRVGDVYEGIDATERLAAGEPIDPGAPYPVPDPGAPFPGRDPGAPLPSPDPGAPLPANQLSNAAIARQLGMAMRAGGRDIYQFGRSDVPGVRGMRGAGWIRKAGSKIPYARHTGWAQEATGQRIPGVFARGPQAEQLRSQSQAIIDQMRERRKLPAGRLGALTKEQLKDFRGPGLVRQLTGRMGNVEGLPVGARRPFIGKPGRMLMDSPKLAGASARLAKVAGPLAVAGYGYELVNTLKDWNEIEAEAARLGAVGTLGNQLQRRLLFGTQPVKFERGTTDKGALWEEGNREMQEAATIADPVARREALKAGAAKMQQAGAMGGEYDKTKANFQAQELLAPILGLVGARFGGNLAGAGGALAGGVGAAVGGAQLSNTVTSGLAAPAAATAAEGVGGAGVRMPTQQELDTWMNYMRPMAADLVNLYNERAGIIERMHQRVDPNSPRTAQGAALRNQGQTLARSLLATPGVYGTIPSDAQAGLLPYTLMPTLSGNLELVGTGSKSKSSGPSPTPPAD